MEVEQEDRALLVPARVDALPYSIFVMNEIVPRQFRKDIFHYLKKNYADHFEGKDLQKELDEMNRRAENIAI